VDTQQRNALGQIVQNDRERRFDTSPAIQEIALKPESLKLSPPVRHSGSNNLSDDLALRGSCHIGQRVICLREAHEQARYTKALKPVMALPTIRFCIWYVPS
jgi:hypothetical protein